MRLPGKEALNRRAAEEPPQPASKPRGD